MAELQSLESFQALYIDLEAISGPRLSDPLLERVGIQVDELLDGFKALLDKKVRNEQSRQSLATGYKPSHEFVYLG